MSIRVCIADGHLLALTGVRMALQDAEEIDVVGATRRGEEIAALVEESRPDLLLLDHRMPGTDAIACLRLLRERHPQTKVVMLSEDEDARQIAEALGAGAVAYIGKRIDPLDLAPALRQIVDGVVYRSGPEPPVEAVRHGDLTKRELTLLGAIARGLSTKVISRELWISEKTVTFHLTNIYRKLGVHNRTGATRYAIEHGLIARPARAGAPAATG